MESWRSANSNTGPDLTALQVFDGLKVMLKNRCFRWLVIAFMISSLGVAGIPFWVAVS